MAELVFFCGTMDCGKSTLALQTDHNHAARGRRGLIFTKLDEVDGPGAIYSAAAALPRPISCVTGKMNSVCQLLGSMRMMASMRLA